MGKKQHQIAPKLHQFAPKIENKLKKKQQKALKTERYYTLEFGQKNDKKSFFTGFIRIIGLPTNTNIEFLFFRILDKNKN